MALGHAAAVLVQQFLQRDAGGRQFHPRIAHAAADAKGAQAVAPVATLGVKPVCALVQQSAQPVQGLEVVLQGRSSEQADFGNVGRAQARLATLALDAFQHRRLFAADVGAGAAPQFQARQRTGRVGLEGGEFLLQQGAAAVVFVAQVEVAAVHADHLGGNQHPFEKAVRVALQVMPVLEGAGFALVDVHGHEARRRLRAHDAPLAGGRKSGAAQAAQSGGIQRAEYRLGRQASGGQGRRQGVAALRAVGRIAQRLNS